MKKKASKIMMIRPVKFGFNEETAASNSFQNPTDIDSKAIQSAALAEFDAFTTKLKGAGIDVQIFEDEHVPHTPDSIFPNNWISFHENMIVLYPMLAENRRKERRKDIVSHFIHEAVEMIDLSENENQLIFLEGTGSIIFDYENKLAYANISPRTNNLLLNKLCTILGYKPITFNAVDIAGSPIYHTNVLMCLGTTFAVICKDSIHAGSELDMVITNLEKTGHEIIDISYTQMSSFAGNMYHLYNDKLESIIIMSEQAYKSLDNKQISQLKKHGTLLHSPLYTIETHGGGSARCMMADVRS